MQSCYSFTRHAPLWLQALIGKVVAKVNVFACLYKEEGFPESDLPLPHGTWEREGLQALHLLDPDRYSVEPTELQFDWEIIESKRLKILLSFKILFDKKYCGNGEIPKLGITAISSQQVRGTNSDART